MIYAVVCCDVTYDIFRSKVQGTNQKQLVNVCILSVIEISNDNFFGRFDISWGHRSWLVSTQKMEELQVGSLYSQD